MEVRPASEADSREVWDWRNDPDSRRQSGNTTFIQWKDHCQWFSQVLESRANLILIGLEQETHGKLGVSRFDLDMNVEQARVSINLNPIYRGRGISTHFLLASVNYYLLHHDLQLTAKVKRENIASAKTFIKAGFEVLSQDQHYLYFNY